MSNVWKTIALPWDETVKSLVAEKDDTQVLQTSILMILLTTPGERLMLPTFGSRLIEKVFQTNDERTAGELVEIVRDNVQQWDDRIIVEDVQTEPSDNDLVVKVSYRNAKDPSMDSSRILEFTVTPSMQG